MKTLYTIFFVILTFTYSTFPSEFTDKPRKPLTGIYFDSSKVNSSLRKNAAKSVKIDSIDTDYHINKVNIDQSAELMTIEVSVPEKETKYQIACFNMLGKKVIDIQSIKSDSGKKEFSVDISKIPNGIYICVLQASNGYKDTEKFIISR